jgi:hypothetical protein
MFWFEVTLQNANAVAQGVAAGVQAG